LFDDDHYSVCEVNSAADFAGFEAATGINVARAVLEYCLEHLGAREAGAPSRPHLPIPLR
jgi:glutathione synthase/RimK-type ligase-like ATP-grasp enzyme